MKRKKRNLWIAGLSAVFLYLLVYFIVLKSAQTAIECWECIFAGFIIGIPCWILGSILPGGKNIIVCNIYNIVTWFLIGLLIGLLIKKVKSINKKSK